MDSNVTRRLALQNRSRKLTAFLQARLSPEGYLGLSLTLGLLVLIGATWLFAAIAEDVVTSDPITIIDVRFSAWLQTHANPTVTTLMLVITNSHSTLPVAMVTLAILIYLWFRRLRHRALTLALAVYGGALLNFLLKNLFLRPRPHFSTPILTLTGYGFPSGHTMGATVFYGTLCAFTVSRVRNWPLRVLAIIVSLVMIALVGFSRIYLGAHYLSDVLGAMAEGLAWLALCFTAVGTIRRRRESRRVRTS